MADPEEPVVVRHQRRVVDEAGRLDELERLRPERPVRRPVPPRRRPGRPRGRRPRTDRGSRRCSSAASSEKSSWYQPWQASSWPPARIAVDRFREGDQRVPRHEPGARDPLAPEQVQDPRRAHPRPELAVRELHRRVAPPDAVRDGVVIERQGDGEPGRLHGRRWYAATADRGRIAASRTPGRRPVDFRLHGDHHRLLHDPGRRAGRDRRGDQEGVPEARPAVAPGRQQGSRRARSLQGDQRGLPGPVRSRAPPALRPVRQRRRRGRTPGAAGFGGFADIFDAFFGGATGGPAGRRGRPTAGSDLRYDLRITFAEAVLGTEKEIEFPVLGRCETCAGTGAKAGTEADHLPAVQRPRRGPVGPPDDARPDGQRHDLPALPGRREARRDALRDVPRRRPDGTPADAPGDDPGRHRRGPPDPPLQRGRGGAARRSGGQPVRRGPRHAAPAASSARAPSSSTRPASGSPRRRSGRRSSSPRSRATRRRSRSSRGRSRGRRSGSAAAACRTCVGASAATSTSSSMSPCRPGSRRRSARRSRPTRRRRARSSTRAAAASSTRFVTRSADAGGLARGGRPRRLGAERAGRQGGLAGARGRGRHRGRRGRQRDPRPRSRLAGRAWSPRTSSSTRGSARGSTRPAPRSCAPTSRPATPRRRGVPLGRSRPRSAISRPSGCARSGSSGRASSTRPTGPTPGRPTSRSCGSGGGS